jgi:cell division protein FtsA
MTVIPLHPDKPVQPSEFGLLAALDIGSSKVCCMVGERLPAKRKSNDLLSQLRVLGVGHTASRGIHSGAVADVIEAEKAIRLAVDTAERMAGQAISDVYVGVTGGRPVSMCETGMVRVQRGAVSQNDIDAAVTLALKKISIGSRAILHLAPVAYALDGVQTTQAPIGMHGTELTVDLGVVTVEHAYLRNITEAISRAHLQIKGFVMAPYAAAHGVLVNDEMKLGTILVEFGHSLTSVGYFNAGHLVAADSIPLGGQHITNDIALGLTTTLAHAERMKALHGNLLISIHDDLEMLPVPVLGEQHGAMNYVPRGTLTAIMRPRVEEILEHVAELLAKPPFRQSGMARVVLAGGGSRITGLRELAASTLCRHVRIAEIPQLAGLSEAARQPGFSVPTGLLCYALSPDKQYVMPQEAVAAIERQRVGYVRRIGRWIAEAF